MHQKHFYNHPPQPRAVRMQAALGRNKRLAVASPLLAGGAAALSSYLLKMKALSEEAARNKDLSARLEKLERAERQSTSQPSLASTNVDFFLARTRTEMISDTRDQIEANNALTAEMESDIAGYSYVRDGGIAAAAFAAALFVGYSVLRILERREKKKQEKAKQEEPGRERKIARQMLDLAHAKTELKPPERPTYFSEYYSDLVRAIRDQVGKDTGPVAEAVLMVLPLADIHRILESPGELGPCIGSGANYCDGITLQLLKAGLQPEEISKIFQMMDFPPRKH